MPAKAGIQIAGSDAQQAWIPAFAGMISPFVTGYEGTGVESLYPSNTDILRYARQ
jgi:hypothetical protein